MTTTRPPGSGYPYYAGDYCVEFVRAWQDGHQLRLADLSTGDIAAEAVSRTPPANYRNDWGPAGEGAICVIADTDRGNAVVVRLHVYAETGKPGAITGAEF